MTDKDKIKAEVERLKDELIIWPDKSEIDMGRISAFEDILLYIDSLPEEPVSDDLEKAAIEYCGGNTGADARVRAGFVMGGNWQQEQMEKERLAHCDRLTKEQYEIESEFVVKHLKKNNRTPTFIDAIEYGKKMVINKAWEQLERNAPFGVVSNERVRAVVQEFRKAMEEYDTRRKY